MKKFIVLMSHDMSKEQKLDAQNSLAISNIVEAPKNIKSIWANINPVGSLDKSELSKITNWIEQNSNTDDYILIQGEFGATFYIVDYCFKKGLIPVYATTKRRVTETREGDKVITNRVFIHEGYRKYIRYEE